MMCPNCSSSIELLYNASDNELILFPRCDSCETKIIFPVDPECGKIKVSYFSEREIEFLKRNYEGLKGATKNFEKFGGIYVNWDDLSEIEANRVVEILEYYIIRRIRKEYKKNVTERSVIYWGMENYLSYLG